MNAVIKEAMYFSAIDDDTTSWAFLRTTARDLAYNQKVGENGDVQKK